jgi:hypothetical protein
VARIAAYGTAGIKTPVGTIAGRSGMIAVDQRTLNDYNDAISKLQYISRTGFKRGMNYLVYILAVTNHTESQRLSAGPFDYRQENPNLAWKIPVRRITGQYWRRWQMKKIPNGWEVFNDSREAFFIEFGIHTSSRRVRRPIRKMAFQTTMAYAAQSRIYSRVLIDIYSILNSYGAHSDLPSIPGMGRQI